MILKQKKNQTNPRKHHQATMKLERWAMKTIVSPCEKSRWYTTPEIGPLMLIRSSALLLEGFFPFKNRGSPWVPKMVVPPISTPSADHF